jgi:hypothetical protein
MPASQEKPSPRLDETISNEASAATLPPYDKALSTRKWCIVGLVYSYLIAFILLIVGTYLYVRRGWRAGPRPSGGGWIDRDYPLQSIKPMSTSSRELSLLALNFLVTLPTEAIGYVHATSLRWALYHDGRLRHNSNLRLFTSSRSTMPNNCWVNGLWVVLLTVSYSCASQLLYTEQDWDLVDDGPLGKFALNEQTSVNCLAIVLLGTCLMVSILVCTHILCPFLIDDNQVLTLLATWTLLPKYSKHITTWNSSALNTALATQHPHPRPPQPDTSGPATRLQDRMYTTSRSILPMLIFLWFLVPLLCAAGIATWLLTGQQDLSFTFDYLAYIWRDTNSKNWPLWIFDTTSSERFQDQTSVHVLINILFVAALQLLYTIALHVAELFVNLHRDEINCRAASNLNPVKGGAQIAPNAFKSALTAWPTVFLFILKPVSHWVFGLSFPIDLDQGIRFHPLPLFTLMGMAALLASFATYLALRRPTGPQPSAFGKLDLLVNMVNDWGEGAEGRIYWGQKCGLSDEGMRRVSTKGIPDGLREVEVDGGSYVG